MLLNYFIRTRARSRHNFNTWLVHGISIHNTRKLQMYAKPHEIEPRGRENEEKKICFMNSNRLRPCLVDVSRRERSKTKHLISLSSRSLFVWARLVERKLYFRFCFCLFLVNSKRQQHQQQSAVDAAEAHSTNKKIWNENSSIFFEFLYLPR